jgi:hypothetical protein
MGKRGSFHEAWALQWTPQLAIAVIESSRYGTTVEVAADTMVRERATAASSLADLTALARGALLADLPRAAGEVVAALQERAAAGADVPQLMDGVPPLADVVRYGDVRGSDVGIVRPVLDGIVARVCVGLPLACAALDDEAARDMGERIDAVGGAVALLDEPDLRAAWLGALRAVGERAGVHGLVAGRAWRFLLDAGEADRDRVAAELSRTLSQAADAAAGAAWLEGFLAGSGLVLIHDEGLLGLIDAWLAGLDAEQFETVLPLVRRSFSVLTAPERRQLGGRLGRADRPAHPGAAADLGVDTERAEAALDLVEQILGTERPSAPCRLRDVRRDGRGGAGAAVAAGARPGGRGGPRLRALAARPGDRRRARGALRRRGRRARRRREPRVLGAARRALAGRHPRLLPLAGRAGHAAGRDGAPAPGSPAARARGARLGHPRRPPALDDPRAQGRPARALARHRAPRRADGRRRPPAPPGRPRAPGVGGALDRASRTSRPKPRDIDWDRTIRANLKHYQPDQHTIVPERLIGYARRRRALQRELVVCLDQSGSMASSVVYAAVLAGALATLPSLATRLIAFDTEVVDLSEHLADPVDLLFGIQLGGGTDIDQAVAYCETLVTRPRDTVMVLITDLYEGGDAQMLVRRVASLTRAGVQLVVLLALSDDGAPSYDHGLAARIAALGVPGVRVHAGAVRRDDGRGHRAPRRGHSGPPPTTSPWNAPHDAPAPQPRAQDRRPGPAAHARRRARARRRGGPRASCASATRTSTR